MKNQQRKYKEIKVMSFYEFDDIVDMILNYKNDKSMLDKIMSRQETILDSFYYTDALRVLCEEAEINNLVFYFIGYMAHYSYIGLYDEKRREKTKLFIRDLLTYNFDGGDDQIYILIYHIMKNKCYELLGMCLDRFMAMGIDSCSTARLMGLAVKLKDTEALRMFLDRGFSLNSHDVSYLKKSDRAYWEETVMRLIKEYSEKSGSADLKYISDYGKEGYPI